MPRQPVPPTALWVLALVFVLGGALQFAADEATWGVVFCGLGLSLAMMASRKQNASSGHH